jgi:hypothetical protein
MLLGSKVFQKDVTIITLMRRILPGVVQVGEHAHLYECMPKLTLGTRVPTLPLFSVKLIPFSS